MNYNIKFDIIKNRKKFFVLSLLITLLGVLTISIFGLHYGIDFKAGTSIDMQMNHAMTRTQAVDLFKKTGAWDTSTVVTIGGTNNDHVSARFPKVLDQAQEQKVTEVFQVKKGNIQFNTVDPVIAREMANKAIIAVLLASIGIIIYVSIRFEWRFALAAIIALLHDAFIVISFFSIFRWEVNLPFVAAVLTIIGYSINDTIVIFDRIRENLRFAKLKTFQDLANLVNESIWQTMTRSINTIITVLVGALCLFIFGSESIRIFSLAMIIGLVSGGYSSIFIASPIWLLMKSKSIGRGKKILAK